MKISASKTFLKFASLCLALVPLSGFAGPNPANVAYDRTPIFGASREVVRSTEGYVYNFPYRGGRVTYVPAKGSYWEKADGKTSSGTVSAGAPTLSLNSRLPHGCLVFACARAEEVRAGSTPGASRSQAVAFQRTDGSGHAFVIYSLHGKTIAEDDRGYRVTVPDWNGRSQTEALRIARAFSNQTHPANFPQPANAKFIGEY